MNEYDPKSFPLPPELLAGYFDGELDEEDRARVESFLAENPEARAEFDCQSFLNPANEEFLRRVAPPTVSELAWSRVFANVEIELDSAAPPASAILPSQPPTRWSSLATLVALTVTLAGLLFLAVPTPLIPVNEGVVRSHGLEDTIQIASADEIQIYSLDESAASGLLVGLHPLATSPLVLASFEDLDLHGVEPDSQGEYPELRMTPHEAATPMIWAKVEPNPPKER